MVDKFLGGGFIKISAAVFLSVALFSGQTLASFPDTSGHLYESSIDYVQSNGIVQGYPDGTYKPDNDINRAEFTKIIVGAVYGTEQSGGNCFPDVHEEWFAPFICAAQEKGIIQGYPDGWFAPEAEVNFAESLKIVLNAYGAPTGEDYGDWYQKYLDFAVDNDLAFAAYKSPGALVTRGEMAEMIYWIDNMAAYELWTPGTGNPGAGPDGCMSDDDCYSDEYCDPSGICIPYDDYCLTDEDCGAGSTCQGGTCFGLIPIYPSCLSDADCYAGQSCNMDICEFNNPGDACLQDSDCTYQSQICANSMCTEPFMECGEDIDCNTGVGEFCFNGMCARPCTLDTECPTGQACSSGLCDIVYIPECASDADCSLNETCDELILQCI